MRNKNGGNDEFEEIRERKNEQIGNSGKGNAIYINKKPIILELKQQKLDFIDYSH